MTALNNRSEILHGLKETYYGTVLQKVDCCSYSSSSLVSLRNFFWQVLVVDMSCCLLLHINSCSSPCCSVHSWSVSATAGVTKWKQLPQCIESQKTKTEGSYFPVNGGKCRCVSLNMRGLKISLTK